MTSGSALAGRHVHLSADERVARGRLRARQAPRSSHGKWEPAPDRPDPVALLEEQARAGCPELVPIRYGRMLVSPFTFFRGAALLMAADLARPRGRRSTSQLCGDAHLSNFGVFGSPERQLMFDINDFDETLPGPWEWDVKRLAASFEILGRDRGFADADRRAIVDGRRRASTASGCGTRPTWGRSMPGTTTSTSSRSWTGSATEGAAERIGKEEAAAARHVAKARTRDSTRVFAKRADVVDGELRIVADPPLIVPIDDLIRPGA